jgi:hypothetical protein
MVNWITVRTEAQQTPDLGEIEKSVIRSLGKARKVKD